MPSIMSILGYHVYFWSNESDPIEPIHIHISQKPHQNATKVWIKSDGTCEIANNNSQIPEHILHKIIRTVEEFSKEIEDQWIKHFHTIEYIDQRMNDSRDER